MLFLLVFVLLLDFLDSVLHKVLGVRGKGNIRKTWTINAFLNVLNPMMTLVPSVIGFSAVKAGETMLFRNSLGFQLSVGNCWGNVQR